FATTLLSVHSWRASTLVIGMKSSSSDIAAPAFECAVGIAGKKKPPAKRAAVELFVRWLQRLLAALFPAIIRRRRVDKAVRDPPQGFERRGLRRAAMADVRHQKHPDTATGVAEFRHVILRDLRTDDLVLQALCEEDRNCRWQRARRVGFQE